MEEPKKNPPYRPTKLTSDLVALAEQYITDWKLDEDAKVPSIEGLALSLGIARKTIFAWEKEKPTDVEDDELWKRFCNSVDNVRHIQTKLLIGNGLSGTFNSSIAKLLLSNQGYREKSDMTSDDKPLPQPTTIVATDEAVQKGVKAFEEAMRPKR